MSADFETQISPQPGPRKSNKTLIIIIVVAAILFCCCVTALAGSGYLAYWAWNHL